MNLENNISAMESMSIDTNSGNMRYNPEISHGELQEYGLVVGLLLLGFAGYRIINKYYNNYSNKNQHF